MGGAGTETRFPVMDIEALNAELRLDRMALREVVVGF